MDKLKGKQKELDANNDGQISGEDFKLLRERKNKGGLTNAEMYMDAFDKLSRNQRKQVYQTIMSERTDALQDLFGEKKGKIVGGVLNISDRVISPIVGLRGLNLTDNERERFIELALPIMNKVREQKQEGGSMDDQMKMVMNQPMLPDEEMEDNYLDFIIDEALDEEEEDMLMSKLEQDEQLSMLFDKVIEVASEFAGSGPVEGPGSGVSDSIPARLSDGEFVFTAKATEQIGADELMRMMKDAEAAADRQGMQEGGMMEEEQEVDQFGRPIDSDIARDELKKNMMSVNPRYR